jgi:DNA-binding MarR family transcriptional regulator
MRMERVMIKLTDEQRKVMLQLERKGSTPENIPKPVVDELVRLGLLRYEINLTDEGRKVFETLSHG